MYYFIYIISMGCVSFYVTWFNNWYNKTHFFIITDTLYKLFYTYIHTHLIFSPHCHLSM